MSVERLSGKASTDSVDEFSSSYPAFSFGSLHSVVVAFVHVSDVADAAAVG